MSETKVPTTQQIEQRAYELYQERGGEEGHALEDWLTAEKELTQSPDQSSFGASKTRAAAAGFQTASQRSDNVAGETAAERANK